jgi:hypothetical protein
MGKSRLWKYALVVLLFDAAFVCFHWWLFPMGLVVGVVLLMFTFSVVYEFLRLLVHKA